MVEYIPWTELSPERLREKLDGLLARPEPYQAAIADFSMTGLALMRRRLDTFRKGHS
jgi:hypothetical protein